MEDMYNIRKRGDRYAAQLWYKGVLIVSPPQETLGQAHMWRTYLKKEAANLLAFKQLNKCWPWTDGEKKKHAANRIHPDLRPEIEAARCPHCRQVQPWLVSRIPLEG